MIVAALHCDQSSATADPHAAEVPVDCVQCRRPVDPDQMRPMLGRVRKVLVDGGTEPPVITAAIESMVAATRAWQCGRCRSWLCNGCVCAGVTSGGGLLSPHEGCGGEFRSPDS